MCKKLIYLVSFVLVLGLVLTSVADADDPSLVGWWKLDETSGLTAADSSLFGNDGILTGSEWTNGVVGGALEFDGTDSYVSVPSSSSLQLTNALTIAGWIKANSWDSGNDVDPIARKGEGNPNNYQLAVVDGIATFYLDGGEADDDGFVGNTPLNIDQWYHIAATWDGVSVRIYVDGVVDNDPSDSRGDAIGTDTRPFYLGGRSGTDLLDGTLDDIRLYNRALSEAEIKSLAARPQAWNPTPNDGILYEDTWVSLSWSPGDFALSHDVYFSDNYDDVNDGAESAFQGNQLVVDFVVGFPGFPYPDGLVPGTTYYWRIDEINDNEPNSPWKGYVWSFLIPPKTAYAPDPADGAELVDPSVELSWTAGFGSKLHYVYFGDNFDEVDNAAGGLPQGPTTYTPGTLKMAKTYYWRVDEFDVVDTHKGNIWSFTTEGAVTAINPTNGAVDVTQTPVLTWVPGVFVDTHEVFFGADAASLELKGSGNLGSESFEPGQLEWNTTYYWRIDEANNANADSPWTGPLWSFTTANFLIIDDMESYNDLDPADPLSNRIFNVWIDGFDNPAANGSIVGHANPPFAEQSIVHGGNQSMPFAYDNAVGKSEATLTLTSNRDWTVNGVDTLTIWFRGDGANTTEQMYVALNGNARIDHDDPDAATSTSWTEWNIDLQAFADQGVNLTKINSITLGLGNRNNPIAGGSGMMYFDDIRLYETMP
ncbi:MAG: LamG domain-containing protein [Planctomycetota bacterium]|jgi:hypothetical protein